MKWECINIKLNPILAHTVTLKQQNGSKQVRVDNGQWINLKVSLVNSDSSRFTLKCSLDGVVSTFSAVITPDQIDIFNEVKFDFQIETIFSINR